MKNTSSCGKSENTNAEDEEEEILSPIRNAEDSPQKLGESSSKKMLAEESPSKTKEKENKTEGADLMIAEEKEYDKVRISDYVKLFSFSYGAWTMGLYFFQCVICAVIQLFLSYFLTLWTS